MTYAKYINKGDKVYGPYYYRSYREGYNVKKEYLGKRPKKEAAKRFPGQNMLDKILRIIGLPVSQPFPKNKTAKLKEKGVS